MSYGEHRKALVKELKARLVRAGAKGVHVRGGRGTAWGWIDIRGSRRWGEFTARERRIVERITGRTTGANFWCAEIDEVERMLGVRPYFERR